MARLHRFNSELSFFVGIIPGLCGFIFSDKRFFLNVAFPSGDLGASISEHVHKYSDRNLEGNKNKVLLFVLEIHPSLSSL